MVFVRTWLRALLSASGATLLVPVGLVLAVAVAATVGGTGLGQIGQVFHGPALPTGEPLAARVPAGGAEPHPTQTSTVPAIPVAPRRSASPLTRRLKAPNAPTRAVQVPGRGTPSRRPARLPAPKAKRRPSQAAAQPTTPAAPTKPPAQQDPVRRVGSSVQHSVAPVPVVGPAAADAVGTVVDLVSPPPPPAATPTATAPPPAVTLPKVAG